MNLGLHISKLICAKLDGDLSMRQAEDGSTFFVFFVRCLSSAQLLQPSLGSLDLGSAKTTDDHSSQLNLSKILVVTSNVMDKLAMQFTLNELSLKDQLQFAQTVLEAGQLIVQLFEKSTFTEGFAIIIIDAEVEQENKLKQTIDKFKRNLADHQITYQPKIVLLSAGVKLKKEKLIQLGIDYLLSKPIFKQDFIRLFKAIKYHYRNFGT